MKNIQWHEILNKFGIKNHKSFIEMAFSRNIGLLTPHEQEQLSHARVAIPGMGGVGGVHLITLARTGIGKFNIADFDVFEPPNINRQYGARVPDLGRKKIEIMKEQALAINPFLEINLFEEGIHQNNIDRFLKDVDVVIDGLDFFLFDLRRKLFKKAVEKGIWVITAGPMGFSSAMLVFDPNGMGFDEYFNVQDDMPDKDKYLSFALGLSPRPTHIKYMNLKKVDLESKAGPSTGIACQICSGMAATETLKILLNRKGLRPVPSYVQFDPYLMKLRKGCLFYGNRNPIQQAKIKAVKYLLGKNKTFNQPHVPIPSADGLKSGTIPNDVLHHIITMGTWAPSADNCQPWKFSWDGRTLSLIKAPDRSGFFYDINQESTFLTFGALIENIIIASSHFKLIPKIRLFPKGHDHTHIAELVFETGEIEEDPLYPHILSRCVNRYFYRDTPINPEIVKILKTEVAQEPNTELIWIDNQKDKKIFQRVVYDADRILFEDERLHKCLFRWINLKSGIKKDGMDLDMLGLNLVQKAIFPLMANWGHMQMLNKLGASRMAGFNSVRLLRSSPAYALIAFKERAPSNYINGGRSMERFWIRANSLGLCLQPMAGFVFLWNHFQHNKGVLFSEHHANLIRRISERLSSTIDKLPLMFFRVGISSNDTGVRTQRMVQGDYNQNMLPLT